MLSTFHENRIHGTTTFPLQIYSHHDKDGFYTVSQHWHEELEWLYVDTGTLNLTIHGKPYVLHAGEFCFINAGELHEIQSTGTSLHHAIVFQANFLNFELYDTCEHQFIRPVTSRDLIFPTRVDQLPQNVTYQILQHLRRIVELYHGKFDCFQLSIKIQILQVLEILYQSHAFVQPTNSEKEDENLKKLKKVITYMKENYAQPLSLDELSSLIYLSPTYFCRYFRKETGKSPIAFLNEYRIQQAAKMLTQSSQPISQIASAVGFDNFSYFIRKFREYKRISPKEYRKQTSHFS